MEKRVVAKNVCVMDTFAHVETHGRVSLQSINQSINQHHQINGKI